MTSDLSAEITAIATAVLALFAIATAYYARRAFLKQSQEVRAIEQQVKDQEELSRRQADLLQVQSGQLELQRHQFDEQRKLNERQSEVLELQAEELRESLDQRKIEAVERRSSQALQVLVQEERYTYQAVGKATEKDITVYVSNTSQQPIYEVWFSWHSGDKSYAQNRRDEPLMPGGKDHDSAQVPLDVDPDEFGAVVIFRDRAGVWWRARPDGRLDEVEPGSKPQSMPPGFWRSD